MLCCAVLLSCCGAVAHRLCHSGPVTIPLSPVSHCSNVPTLLVYYRGEVRANLVGLSQFGGQKATADCVEWVLSKQGALTTELDEDPRKKLDGSGRGGRGGLFGGRGGRGDSDEDDD